MFDGFSGNSLANAFPSTQLPQIKWRTCKGSNYTERKLPAAHNLTNLVPFDTNWGRWQHTVIPRDGDFITAWQKAPQYEEAVPQPTDYQFVEYWDKRNVQPANNDVFFRQQWSHVNGYQFGV